MAMITYSLHLVCLLAPVCTPRRGLWHEFAHIRMLCNNRRTRCLHRSRLRQAYIALYPQLPMSKANQFGKRSTQPHGMRSRQEVFGVEVVVDELEEAEARAAKVVRPTLWTSSTSLAHQVFTIWLIATMTLPTRLVLASCTSIMILATTQLRQSVAKLKTNIRHTQI